MTTNGLAIVHNWSICCDGPQVDFTSPEMLAIKLQGTVYGHPSIRDGQSMVSSKIVEIKARKVWTQSGTKYRLGRIDPEYRKWLKSNYPSWNWRLPISIKYV